MQKIVYPPELNWQVSELRFARNKIFGVGMFQGEIDMLARVVQLNLDGTFVKPRECFEPGANTHVLDVLNPYTELRYGPARGGEPREEYVRPIDPGDVINSPMWLAQTRTRKTPKRWYAGWSYEYPDDMYHCDTVLQVGARGGLRALYSGPKRRDPPSIGKRFGLRATWDEIDDDPDFGDVWEHYTTVVGLNDSRVLIIDVDGFAEVLGPDMAGECEPDLGPEVRAAYPKLAPTVLTAALSRAGDRLGLLWTDVQEHNVLSLHRLPSFAIERIMEVPFTELAFAPDGLTLWGLKWTGPRRTKKTPPLELYGIDLD